MQRIDQSAEHHPTVLILKAETDGLSKLYDIQAALVSCPETVSP